MLDFNIATEGRAIPNGSSYQYEYHIKDHLDNVRVAFINNNGTPQLVQTNNYYPFGMLMAERTNTGTNRNLTRPKKSLPIFNLILKFINSFIENKV